jgi:hypothetical protein
MAETFTVIFLLLASCGIFVYVRFRATNPANHNPQLDLDTLRRQCRLIEERLMLAERDNWGADLVRELSRQHADIRAKLARLDSTAGRSA